MKKTWMLLVITATMWGCKSTKPVASVDPADEFIADEIILNVNTDYRGSAERIHDLLHTKLDVRFDYKKKYLNGKANLTIKPFHYPSSSLTLDAKGMDILQLSLVKGSQMIPLKYSYDSMQIRVELDKIYQATDTYQIFIQYTAKPDELESGGSAAITSDKGLYFIDPDSSDAEKPTQIWTQGETEAASCWFPTIDKPNERCTGEISITYDSKYLSISNGIKKSSVKNGDGTITDYWVMDKPHAPYLFMMTVGEFAEIKDKWRNLDVNYYVEKSHAPYAKKIFGNTPEMIEFFSKKLGYEYPWQKYDQVVVRDYVSGAMENTGAVIFGEFMQRDHRELLDKTDEDIVAHELFHHWFGDLVTCESWSNLPLNESFATYGEYLWCEYKYGRAQADFEQYESQMGYLMESKQKNVDMIRYYYEDKEDMFDGHSYNKGGWILHMLRYQIGDEAFFGGIKNYLHKHAYKPVEIHDLRLAFEEVTGQDLNWFFNQWFFNSGHPILDINTQSREDSIIIKISQKHNCEKGAVFQLPIVVHIHYGNQIEEYKTFLRKKEGVFAFAAKGKPDLIEIDPERILLCEKKETKTTEQYAFQLEHSKFAVARIEAIKKLKERNTKAVAREALLKHITDPFYVVRYMSLDGLKLNKDSVSASQLNEIKLLAERDPKSVVRATALDALAKLKMKEHKDVFVQALGDSSYAVVSRALSGLYKYNAAEGLEKAESLAGTKNARVLQVVGDIYSKEARPQHQAFYEDKIKTMKSWYRYGMIGSYGTYLSKIDDSNAVLKGVSYLKELAGEKGNQYIPQVVSNALIKIRDSYEDKKKPIQKQIDATKDKKQKEALKLQFLPYDTMIAEIQSAIDSIPEEEKAH